MTRQKKEILRQIDEIERDIEIDRQLAFGMAPPGAYDSMYQQIDDLWDELASIAEMYISAACRGLPLTPMPPTGGNLRGRAVQRSEYKMIGDAYE